MSTYSDDCSFEVGKAYRELYSERKRIKSTDPLGADSLKLLMNSSYGHFAMKDVAHDSRVEMLDSASFDDAVQVNAMRCWTVPLSTTLCK